MDEAVLGSAQLVEQVAQAYGVTVLQARPQEGGLVHPSWRLETPAGPWFAKLYRGAQWSAAVVAVTLVAQQAASQAGLPVPDLRADRGGKTLSPFAGGHLVCMSYLPGARLGPDALTPAHAAVAGDGLGRLHQALAAVPVAPPPLIPDAAAIAQQCRELLAQAQAGTEAGDVACAQSLQYRLGVLDRDPIDPGAYAGCRWQVCHGDYYPSNLLFQGSELSGIVDFDFAGPRWLTMELARACIETAWLPQGGVDPHRFRAFLGAYLARHPLPLHEVSAGPRFWWEYLLHSLYPIPLRYTDASRLPEHWLALLHRRHGLMVWLGDHLDDLQTLSS